MISIWGKWHRTGKTERIDTAASKKDAAYLVGEYQMAFGQDWHVWSGRKQDGNRDGARNETATTDSYLLRRNSNL